MRSATAPVIRAAVMIANDIWKTMNTVSGTEPLVESRSRPARNSLSKPPTMPQPSENARLYPTTIQSTVIRQTATKLCITVLSTFFLRTMPP